MGYQLLFANNAVGVLAVSCTANASTLQLSAAQAALFPVPAQGQAFYVQLQNGAAFESVLVTNNSGGVFTVLRGQEGTVAQPFAAGTVVTLRVTAAVLGAFLQASSSAFAALFGNANQTFDVAQATGPNNAVPLSQAQTLFANITQLPSAGQIAQPGDIKYSAVNTVPSGWLRADGSLVSRTTYAALFTAIGTTYGAGDGATTFALPDCRGVFLRGFDSGRGLDPSRTFGSYQADRFAAHSHANTLGDGGHSHGVTDPTHFHTEGGTVLNGRNGTAGASVGGGGISTTNSTTTYPSSTGITINTAVTGITISNAATGGSETAPKNIAFICLIKT
jgi:microcystin-dependent protein